MKFKNIFDFDVDTILPGLKDVQIDLSDSFRNGKDFPNTIATEWHKNRPDSWLENVKEQTYMKQWANNDSRRKTHAKKFSETWEKNYDYMAEQARKNGQHGFKGKDVHNTLEIEYKGKKYWGWKSLKESTGVSKHLYKKYYMNGLDAESRIDCNGPVKKI